MQFSPEVQAALDVAPPLDVLAKSTLQLIDNEIEGREWFQGDWILSHDCGTTACVAGHIALEVGGKPHGPFGAYVTFGNGAEAVRRIAAAALGQSRENSQWLFYGGRTEPEVRWALQQIIEHGTFDPAEAPAT